MKNADLVCYMHKNVKNSELGLKLSFATLLDGQLYLYPAHMLDRSLLLMKWFSHAGYNNHLVIIYNNKPQIHTFIDLLNSAQRKVGLLILKIPSTLPLLL